MIDILFSRPLFLLDSLSGLIAFAVAFFFILTIIYSSKFMKGKNNSFQYYFLVCLTAIFSFGVVLTNNLILLLVCWGFLSLMLYLLINMGGENAAAAAKKSLIIVGGSDVLILFAFAMIIHFTNSSLMNGFRLELNSGIMVIAFVFICIACFAKAGAMPMHSWIPDCAEKAPIPVTAYLPASLDKLLSIYLLVRVCLNMFVMNRAMNNFLMIIGAFTIIAAVMMALIQHNMKRLMGYHAVSQVGYMLLGIGTGNVIGIAGGIFHMLNHAVYKSCLFFSAGNVEYRTKTAEIDELGGLSKSMPITFVSCLIASLSISGIPPFNGFVSKWLIYQGVISNIPNSGSTVQLCIYIFCLAAAMFGSALTLASFMKLIHAVFLGQRSNPLQIKGIKEVPLAMWGPCIILASVCILFGVFAFVLPLKYFIFPAVSMYQPINNLTLIGTWQPVLVTLLIIIGLILGVFVFKLSGMKLSIRQDITFTGGEIEDQREENMVTGSDFYNTIKEFGFLNKIYKKAQIGAFDIYEQARKVLLLSKPLQYLHNGILPTYLAWILLGMLWVSWVLLFRQGA